MLYPWIKAFHIIAMVCWFAGLFYLPRLFVYHAMAEDAQGRARFTLMERKLYRGIMTPAMLATLLGGIWLLMQRPDLLSQGWMHAKLTLVCLLLGYHHLCGRFMRRFRDDQPVPGHVWFRWFNEVPVLALAGAVVLVVVRPF